MALRCLLVSLVASLGFELPNGQDVTSWTMSGRGWVSARVVDLSAMQAEASGWLGLNDPTVKRMVELAAVETTPTTVTEMVTPATSAELVFESINESMAVDFNHDYETIVANEPTATPVVSMPVVVATTTEADYQPEIGGDTNPEIESMTLALAEAETDCADTEMGVEEEESVTTDSAARLTSAVRLTREAVQAWASLVQSVGDDLVPTR